MVLISLTKVGLKRLLHQLEAFCKNEALTINFDKTKVMVFRKRPKNSTWSILGNQIKQYSSFKCHGITFRETLNWSAHVALIKSSAFRIIVFIMSFFYSKEGLLIDSALKLFTSKIIPHLMYEVEEWGWNNVNLIILEVVQNYF